MRNNNIRFCLLIASLCLLAFIISPALPAAGQSGGTGYRYFLTSVFGPDKPRWTGPDGGSVVSMAVDPKNGNIVYAGSWGGGVFKSTDGGAHWQSASSGITNLLIHSLTIDPVETNRIYAGTYGKGVFRSEDGGATWVSASSGMRGTPIVYALVTNVGEYHNMVYAGTRDDSVDNGCLCGPWGGVLYKSWDYGKSWKSVLYNVGGSDFQDWVYGLAVDPVNYNNVLAATHMHGVYWTDAFGGDLWEWNHASGISADDTSTRALAFNMRGGTALVGNFDTKSHAVLRSRNEGQSWSVANNGLDQVRIFPNALSAANTDPDRFYAGSWSDNPGEGTRGVYRTDNGGDSWYRVGLDGVDLYTVRASTTNASVVYAGALYEGLLKSTNGGWNWSKSMSGITNTNVTGVARPYSNLIIISTYGDGIFYSWNDGANWYPLSAGLGDNNVNGLFSMLDKPWVLYALTQSAGLKRLDLSVGGPWNMAGNPTQALENSQWEGVQEFKANEQPVNLPAGEQNPFKLVDPANEFPSAPDAAGVTSSAPLAGLVTNAPVLSMAESASEPKVMYVGTNGSGVYATSDGGTTWVHASGMSGLIVRGLAVNQEYPQNAYAATSKNGAVMVTLDGGVNWFSSALPLSDSYVYAVATAKDANGSTIIYVGTNKGLWALPPGTNTWVEMGLPGVSVTAIAPDPAQPWAVYAGTTNGAYYSSASQHWGVWNAVSPQMVGHVIQTISFDQGAQHAYFGANSHGLFIMPLVKYP